MCKNKVVAMCRRDGSEVKVQCGSWFAGEQMTCAKCEKRAEKMYPQGWRHYPGDTCRHGVYVGGCGIDYMCSRCEADQD